jgi:signal transduction histidine kinase
MLIQELIRTDFETIEPYQCVKAIKHNLAAKNALVVMEQGKYLGLLTPRDVVLNAHNLVIDCVVPKPSVSPQNFLKDVLNTMVAENTEALSVFDEESFVGVVYKTDILLLLHKINQEQQEHIKTIVHDLRNPIANISGLAEMLKFDTAGERQQLIGYAEDACDFANEIINDLLISTEIEENTNTLSKQRTDIFAFLRLCLSSISGSAMIKDIEVKDALPDTALFMAIDKLKFRRAILNLLSNAIKFTHEGGYIKLSAKEKKKKLIIVIEDNGIGIPQKLQPILFEKFTKAKRQGTNKEKSTGLGMYITKQFVELHDGKIWLESEEDKGTTFYVELGISL